MSLYKLRFFVLISEGTFFSSLHLDNFIRCGIGTTFMWLSGMRNGAKTGI